MRLGVVFPQTEIGSDPAVIRDYAQAAEGAGYHHLLVFDHVLGAKLDGTLRSHAIMPNGTLRDTVVYSITATEWPMVQSHLNWQLTKPRPVKP